MLAIGMLVGWLGRRSCSMCLCCRLGVGCRGVLCMVGGFCRSIGCGILVGFLSRVLLLGSSIFGWGCFVL